MPNLVYYKKFSEIIFYIITQFVIMCSIDILRGGMNDPIDIHILSAQLCTMLISFISLHWGQNVFRNINLHTNSILFCFLCCIVGIFFDGLMLWLFIIPLLTLFREKKEDIDVLYVPLLVFLIILLCLLYCYFYGLQTLYESLSMYFILVYVLSRAIIYKA